jgi:hypothetical protein
LFGCPLGDRLCAATGAHFAQGALHGRRSTHLGRGDNPDRPNKKTDQGNMKNIAWLAILIGAFYAHSRFVFTERYVASWAGKQDLAVLEGKDNMCDAFSKDIQVSMLARSPQGHTAFEGGYDAFCNYNKEASRMLKATPDPGSASTPRWTGWSLRAFPG